MNYVKNMINSEISNGELLAYSETYEYEKYFCTKLYQYWLQPIL